MTTVWLTYRQHRVILRFVALAALGMTVVGILLRAGFSELAAIGCWAPVPPAGIDCGPPADAWTGLWVNAQVFEVAACATLVILALLVMTPLVASEIERRTALLAWTLAPDRRRWLLPRAGLLIGCLVAAAALFGVISDLVVGAAIPDPSPWLGFTGWQARGLSAVGLVLVAGCASLLAGSLAGRLLPGLLLAIALAGAILLGLFALDRSLVQSDPVPYAGSGGIEVGVMYRDRAGNLIDPAQAETLVPPDDPSFDATYTLVAIGRPAADAPLAVGRSFGLHALAALGCFLASLVVVSRRRPF